MNSALTHLGGDRAVSSAADADVVRTNPTLSGTDLTSGERAPYAPGSAVLPIRDDHRRQFLSGPGGQGPALGVESSILLDRHRPAVVRVGHVQTAVPPVAPRLKPTSEWSGQPVVLGRLGLLQRPVPRHPQRIALIVVHHRDHNGHRRRLPRAHPQRGTSGCSRCCLSTGRRGPHWAA